MLELNAEAVQAVTFLKCELGGMGVATNDTKTVSLPLLAEVGVGIAARGGAVILGMPTGTDSSVDEHMPQR